MPRKTSLPPPPTPPVTPPAPPNPPAPWYYLSLSQWRASDSRVKWLAELQRDERFRELLGMLHWEAAQRNGAIPLTPEAIATEFGRSEGRRDVLQWLSEAAEFRPQTLPLTDPDYGVPNPQ